MSRRRGPVRLLAIALWAGPLFALYIALADNTHPYDLLVGGVCALLGATAAVLAGWLGRIGFRPRAGWLLRSLQAPWWIVRDSVMVLLALLGHVLLRRPLAGEMVPVRFAAGGDDARSAARRALAFSAGSAGPNSYAIGVDAESDVLVTHQLVPTDEQTSRKVVGEA